MVLQLISYVVFPFVIYALIQAIYRAYFSPLSKIPGPKLAAMTQCYEMYYDLIQAARFPWQIKRLHELYGMVSSELIKRWNPKIARSDRSNISVRSSY